jgi:hypothetical protein
MGYISVLCRLIRICKYRLMHHLVCTVRYSVVPLNCSLLTIILYSSARTTLVYNDTKYSGPFMTFYDVLTEFDCIWTRNMEFGVMIISKCHVECCV